MAMCLECYANIIICRSEGHPEKYDDYSKKLL